MRSSYQISVNPIRLEPSEVTDWFDIWHDIVEVVESLKSPLVVNYSGSDFSLPPTHNQA